MGNTQFTAYLYTIGSIHDCKLGISRHAVIPTNTNTTFFLRYLYIPYRLNRFKYQFVQPDDGRVRPKHVAGTSGIKNPLVHLVQPTFRF
jgi:hypothetical protein